MTGVGRALLLVPLTLWPREASHRATESLPRSALYVLKDGSWQEWWNSAHAPISYDERNAALAPLVGWRPIADGVEVGDLQLSGSGEAWRLRVVLARIDPKRVEITAVPYHGIGRRTWTIDSMSADALLAMNGGQFRSSKVPWGWLVIDGVERQQPQLAPLAMAMVIDSAGHVQFLTRAEVRAARAVRRRFRLAFQSYPVALVDGVVPAPLRKSGLGLDVAHRDGRLAICAARDGRLVVALTRFDALKGQVPELPFGTTAPEMAAVMGGLGCVRALMLDGGISRHFGVREKDALTLRHKGWRAVPMGLEVRALPPRPR